MSWFENRPSEEIPAENLWSDPKGLEEWWERIKNRKEYSKGRENYDPKQVDEDIVDNDLARQFKS